MAVVTSDFLAGLFTNFQVWWEEAFLAAQNQVQFERYCAVLPSTTDTESYNWLGTVPKMQEWISNRQMGALSSFNYSLKNKHYESSFPVDRDTLEDDRYNAIRPRITQLGMEAARYPAEIAATTLVNGTSNACYDGANFFATTHAEGVSGTQSNLLTGSGGDTLAHVRTDLIAGRTAMRRYKDDQGRPTNLKPDLVVCPPDLQDLFEQLIHTNMIALSSGTQQSNVLLNAVDVWTDANLADTVDWYLMSTQQVVMKSLIYQLRKAPEFAAVDAPTDAQVFMTRTFWYGVDSRFVFGYGDWRTAIKVNN